MVDDLAAWRTQPSQATLAEQRGIAAVTRARQQAAATGKSRLVTANEGGFEDLYAEDLRNNRVPVANASPADSWDWTGRYILACPGLLRVSQC